MMFLYLSHWWCLCKIELRFWLPIFHARVRRISQQHAIRLGLVRKLRHERRGLFSTRISPPLLFRHATLSSDLAALHCFRPLYTVWPRYTQCIFAPRHHCFRTASRSKTVRVYPPPPGHALRTLWKGTYWPFNAYGKLAILLQRENQCTKNPTCFINVNEPAGLGTCKILLHEC